MARLCEGCKGRLRRVHRTFLEKFVYMAVLECSACRRRVTVPRPFMYYLSDECRCPKCGTFRLQRLTKADPIDPLYRHPVSMWNRLSGGRLYHCPFCRVQFYDRRHMAPDEVAMRVRA